MLDGQQPQRDRQLGSLLRDLSPLGTDDEWQLDAGEMWIQVSDEVDDPTASEQLQQRPAPITSQPRAAVSLEPRFPKSLYEPDPWSASDPWKASPGLAPSSAASAVSGVSLLPPSSVTSTKSLSEQIAQMNAEMPRLDLRLLMSNVGSTVSGQASNQPTEEPRGETQGFVISTPPGFSVVDSGSLADTPHTAHTHKQQIAYTHTHTSAPPPPPYATESTTHTHDTMHTHATHATRDHTAQQPDVLATTTPNDARLTIDDATNVRPHCEGVQPKHCQPLPGYHPQTDQSWMKTGDYTSTGGFHSHPDNDHRHCPAGPSHDHHAHPLHHLSSPEDLHQHHIHQLIDAALRGDTPALSATAATENPHAPV